MSTERLPLPDILRGLILLGGLSTQEMAVRAGVSPGSVAALCERTPKPLLTWLRMIASLGGRVGISWQDRTWSVAMPRTAAPVVEREWASWRNRRVVTTINHLRSADPRARRSVLMERAASYAANEEGRLRERLTGVRQATRTLGGTQHCDGLRAALRLIADRLGLKAEELTLLSGASLSACQLALGETRDGRLATVHRLLSALGARLHIHLAAGMIGISRCAPGDWCPGMVEVDEDAPAARSAARPAAPGARSGQGQPNRSRLDTDELLALYDRGLSIGDIARRAGVSRQRIHKLAIDHGRAHRRQQAREQRVEHGREVLGMA